MKTRVLAVAACTFAACSFDFADPGAVVDRRILSVVADPPQLHKGVRTVTMSALVVEPGDMMPSDSFQWSYCLMPKQVAGGGGAAPGGFGAASATRCGDAGTVLAQGIAPIDQLMLEVPAPPVLPDELIVQVELNVGGDAGLYAVKRISPPPDGGLDGGDPPNTNPVLSGLQFDGVDWPEDGGIALTIGACTTGMVETMKSVGRGGTTTTTFCAHTLTPLYDDAEHQPYTSVDALGDVTAERERLRFAWFSDQGTIERDTSSEPNMTGVTISTSTDGGTSTTWREPKDGGTEANVWIVVRDGRGGESFTQRVIHYP